MVRVRFAGVSALSERGITIAFGLPRRLHHPRIRKVEHYPPSWYGHFLRITNLDELDDQLRAWLAESRHEMGEQARLAGC